MSRLKDKLLLRECERGRADRALRLLDEGAQVNRLHGRGMTPLMVASYQGHRELVELLLARSADPNLTASDGASALFWACVRGHHELAMILIRAGADVTAARGDTADQRTYTVLHAAIGNGGSAALVEALVKAGAAIDDTRWGEDAIEHASRAARDDLVELLRQMERRSRTR